MVTRTRRRRRPAAAGVGMLAVCGGGLAALAFSALAQPAAAHAPPPVGGGGPSSWQQGGWRPNPSAGSNDYPPYPGSGSGSGAAPPSSSSRRPPPPSGSGGGQYQSPQYRTHPPPQGAHGRPQWQQQPQQPPPPRQQQGGYYRETSGPPAGAASGASVPPPVAPRGPPPPLPSGPGGAGGKGGKGQAAAPWHGADLSVLDKEQFFDELKQLYRKKVLPLELSSKYAQFHSAPLNPADFDAKPMVLLLGQYSVGKTSFIRSLLQRDFPGQRVGPEPTTDRFMAVMYGNEERLVPGHALAMQADKPFRGVAAFGNNFLTKFEAAEVPAAILRNITLIDSPGILSGEKQRLGRDYDYQSVIQWFADRADLIIIMFDAHKLDISDELRVVMDALRIHQDKIRILLNKADQIDSQQLMRIYGALMWSLGKVVNTPEVCRVYIGSFWEHPLANTQNRFLLEREKQDLLSELDGLPQNAVVRRINELVKRARSVKVHAYLIHYLRKQVPTVFGKTEKQDKLIASLDREFVACARRYGLPLGDFPDVNKFRARLREVKDLRKFPKLDKSMVYEMDKVFSVDIPKLLEKASHKPGGGRGHWQAQHGGYHHQGGRGRR